MIIAWGAKKKAMRQTTRGCREPLGAAACTLFDLAGFIWPQRFCGLGDERGIAARLDHTVK